MSQQTSARATWLAAATLVSLVLVGHGLLTAPRLVDLDVYRMGGAAVLSDLPLYEQRLDGGDGLPFTYPPFAALLLAPFSLVPAWFAYASWTALSVLALAAIVTRALPVGLLQQRLLCFTAVLAACVLVEPVQRTFHFGQVNLLLCAMVLLDIGRREGSTRGVLLGIAAGIKLTPLFFFAFLLLTRQWQALRTATATFLATVLAGFALLPASAWQFWTRTMADTDRIGTVFSVSNQSVLGCLRRVGTPDALERPLWFLLSAAVGTAVLLVAAHHWSEGRAVTAVSLCGLGMTVASPISWSHHWVWAVPLTLSLLNASPTSARFRLDPLAVVFGAVFALRLVWRAPHAGDEELHWGPLTSLLGNVYLVATLVLVGVLALRATQQSAMVGVSRAWVGRGHAISSAGGVCRGPDPDALGVWRRH